MESITIGYCSKQHNDAFKNYLRKNFGKDCQIIEKIGNQNNPICKCYNEIINESINDIIILIHDDVIFEKQILYPYPLATLFQKLFENNEYGIIGAIGGSGISLRNLSWANGVTNGHLIQSYKYKRQRPFYINNGNLKKYSAEICKVTIIDGLLIAINKNKIKVLFDETNPFFHFYDVDFCLSNYTNNVKIGVTKAFLVHHFSEGCFKKEYELSKNTFFLPKWHNYIKLLPKNTFTFKPNIIMKKPLIIKHIVKRKK